MSKLPRLLPLIAVAIGGIVAVRAVGAAPGLFEGARAWAEEAAPAAAAAEKAAPARTAAGVCALTPEQLADQAGISPAELRIIQSLSTRRGELDARDQDFATMLPLMVAAEQKIDAKLKAMEAIKAEVNTLLGQVDEKQKAEIDRLVSVYSAMRPKEAAAVFNTLNDSVRLPVAAAMRPRTLAAIMAQMPPAGAKELTEKLARRFEAQALVARAAAAAAPTATAQTGAATAPAASGTATATPAAVPPATSPAAQAPAEKAASPQPAPRRTAAPPPRRTAPARKSAAAPAAPEPTGPRPYDATAAAPANAAPPRQSVQ